tara:strand:- start:447 stop:596 length:150 start_codon:yes stop_codon:yes gene_type:complete
MSQTQFQVRTIEEDICYLQRDLEYKNSTYVVKQLQRLQTLRLKLVSKKG